MPEPESSKTKKTACVLGSRSPVKVYTSYSGCDIICEINGCRVGEVQGISWHISRKRLFNLIPLPRKITGSMTFVLFDRHALSQFMDKVNYVDEIPKFKVVLTGVNEYGNISTMSISGCKITSEGSSISVDDIINEMALEFEADEIEAWHSVGYPGKTE